MNRNEAKWKAWKDNNADSYGQAILRYATEWAIMMEAEMEAGAKLEDIAERLSFAADTEGITGFMQSAAVSVLANCWEHGEELRRWHNLHHQIGDEGEQANEKGKTLNTALLNINVA